METVATESLAAWTPSQAIQILPALKKKTLKAQ